MPEAKRGYGGRWSNEDKEFIEQNATKMPAQEIAVRLGKKLKTVKAYIKKNVGYVHEQARPEDNEKVLIRQDLRKTLAWQKLKDEFSEPELCYFEEEYVALVAQFKDDVLKTEEQQIRKAITIDILMRRNLVGRKKALEDIVRLERLQGQASRDYERERKSLSQDNRTRREAMLLNIETQLQGARAAEQSKTKEYSDLDNRHQKLMEALKATREQRISRVETSKRSYLEVLKDLQEADKREVEGRHIEMMKRASEREYRRLAAPHQYADGNEDLPILSAETVKLLDEQEEDDEKLEPGEAGAPVDA